MTAVVRPGESHRGNYSDPIREIVRLYRRPPRRFPLGSLLLCIVCAFSLARFVTGSLATPVRDELFSFLVFVITGTLIVQRARIRRRGWRRARAPWVGERAGCAD